MWPSWCHCHSLSLASAKSRLVLPFWYWLTRVVKRAVKLVCVCVCVRACVCVWGKVSETDPTVPERRACSCRWGRGRGTLWSPPCTWCCWCPAAWTSRPGCRQRTAAATTRTVIVTAMQMLAVIVMITALRHHWPMQRGPPAGTVERARPAESWDRPLTCRAAYAHLPQQHNTTAAV